MGKINAPERIEMHHLQIKEIRKHSTNFQEQLHRKFKRKEKKWKEKYNKIKNKTRRRRRIRLFYSLFYFKNTNSLSLSFSSSFVSCSLCVSSFWDCALYMCCRLAGTHNSFSDIFFFSFLRFHEVYTSSTVPRSVSSSTCSSSSSSPSWIFVFSTFYIQSYLDVIRLCVNCGCIGF